MCWRKSESKRVVGGFRLDEVLDDAVEVGRASSLTAPEGCVLLAAADPNCPWSHTCAADDSCPFTPFGCAAAEDPGACVIFTLTVKAQSELGVAWLTPRKRCPAPSIFNSRLAPTSSASAFFEVLAISAPAGPKRAGVFRKNWIRLRWDCSH